MASSFFGGSFFDGEFFNSGGPTPPPVVVGKTGTGGIDPVRRIVKPTGLLDRPVKEGRKDVADRIDESRGIQADIAARLAREFTEETQEFEIGRKAIEEMTAAEINREIGVLLRKKIAEDEIAMLLMLAALA